MERDRVTIQEAARRLGVSEGAVRKRVKRNTLEHDKEGDGRVYVYLDASSRRGVDDDQDEGVDPNNSALISQLREEIAYLREESQRKDEIIMQQAMTMRQLSAPQEPQNQAESAEPRPDRVERRPRSRRGLQRAVLALSGMGLMQPQRTHRDGPGGVGSSEDRCYCHTG